MNRYNPDESKKPGVLRIRNESMSYSTYTLSCLLDMCEYIQKLLGDKVLEIAGNSNYDGGLGNPVFKLASDVEINYEYADERFTKSDKFGKGDKFSTLSAEYKKKIPVPYTLDPIVTDFRLGGSIYDGFKDTASFDISSILSSISRKDKGKKYSGLDKSELLDYFGLVKEKSCEYFAKIPFLVSDDDKYHVSLCVKKAKKDYRVKVIALVEGLPEGLIPKIDSHIWFDESTYCKPIWSTDNFNNCCPYTQKN